jgi:hypothetical protein
VVGGSGIAGNFAFTTNNGVSWTTRGTSIVSNCIATNGSGNIMVVGGRDTGSTASYILYGVPPYNSFSVGMTASGSGVVKILWNPYYKKFIATRIRGNTNSRLYIDSSNDGITWTQGATVYNMYSVNDIAWSGRYMIIIGGQASPTTPYLPYDSQNVFILSSDGGVTWSAPATIGVPGGGFAINIARSVIPYYNDNWLVCGQTFTGGAIATSPLNATGTSWTNGINGLTDCTSITNNGSGWWFALNPNTPPIFTQVSLGPNTSSFSNTYVSSSNIVGIPSKIVWTGNTFYCIGTTGVTGNSNILQSTDGITWTAATNGNTPAGFISDIAFTPKTITVSPTDGYKQFFMTSGLSISGSLTNKDWIQLKNITALPQAITAGTGTIILPAITIGDTSTAVVYSSGSSLVAV